MRRAYEVAYDPEVVTIGPFHYKKEGQELLTVTERHKIQFLFRSPYMHNQTSDEKEVGLGKLAEERTRCCYSEAFADICSDDFVRMMVLDGCLILHLFRCWDHNRQFSQEFASGSLLTERWIVPAIGMGLVKLENQLPFFVLQNLYQLTRPNDNEKDLLTLASEFLQSLSLKAEQFPSERNPHHLLALYHSMFQPQPGSYPDHEIQRSSGQGAFLIIPCAKELQYHGILIRKGNERRLLEIKHCEPNSLKIPPLFIDNNIGSILRNLVAYEQCFRDVQPYFTSYIVFLHGLVNSAEDVEILNIKNIIHKNALVHNEEVYQLISGLTKGINFDFHECYLSSVIHTFYYYINIPSAKLRAELSRRSLTKPEVIFTVLGFYVAIIQTAFSFLSVYHK